MKAIEVRLMAYSFSGKRSSGQESRAERRSTGSKLRTKRKRSSQRLNLSSHSLLKRSKIDISQNANFFRNIDVRSGRSGCDVRGCSDECRPRLLGQDLQTLSPILLILLSLIPTTLSEGRNAFLANNPILLV
jgi:hypothetical protein